VKLRKLLGVCIQDRPFLKGKSLIIEGKDCLIVYETKKIT